MAAVVVLSALGVAYCGVYLIFCIRRRSMRDMIGAAAQCLVAAGALALCFL